MNRSHVFPAILLALVFAVATPVVAAASTCSYDVTFTRTSSGDVRIQSVSDCENHTVEKTYLNGVSEYGNTVSVEYEDPAGSQFYCATTYATYWDGLFLAIDTDYQECAIF